MWRAQPRSALIRPFECEAVVGLIAGVQRQHQSEIHGLPDWNTRLTGEARLVVSDVFAEM